MHERSQVVEASASNTWLTRLEQLSAECTPVMISLRRHLHRYPELSFREFETTKLLAEKLKASGLEPVVTSSETGLTCELSSNFNATSRDKVKLIGLRADLDALPFQTTSTTDYASCRSGVMHGCGHDAHSAMLWGAMWMLRQLALDDALPWPISVRGIFQPAEETSEGGPFMIREGAIDRLDHILALHVDPSLSVGHVATRGGPITAGCQQFDVTFTGKSGHIARPHLAADAIAAAVFWINHVYARAHRVHDSRDAAVVSIGTIRGGNAANVVASSAKLSGTVRTLSEATHRLVSQAMEAASDAAEPLFGVSVNIETGIATPAVLNDSMTAKTMSQTAARLQGIDTVTQLSMPSMGAEDFAFFAQHVPACLMRLGIAGSVHGNAPLHTPQFDVDESALPLGAKILAATAIELCKPDGMKSA